MGFKMSLYNELQVGQVIVFTKAPLGSWITCGESYVVEWKGDRSMYFRNQKTGGGTYDRDYCVDHAVLAV